ncbi:MAG: T9SS type A sorting domain-containing protein, partial [Calditrichaceae bacterium]|nr:T9SS type A sorting domain-containing protein [Calditrichaceae bacterium]
FNPATEIRYQLPKESKVEIVVFNVLGQKVQTLVNGKQAAGRYTIRWEGTDAEGQVVPSGMYFLRMKADQFKAERKLMLLK